MSAAADQILAHLRRVDAERMCRSSTPGLTAKVDAIKRFQQRRFAMTYRDLLASERYGPAASFFLDELYGPRDFSERDSQFARVIPAIVRLFPKDIVNAVAALAELHGLSERLDSAMGVALQSAEVNAKAYALAWQRASGPADRERQISMTIGLGRNLDRLTRKPLFRRSLRMMRGPALAAGMEELQSLLERGFDAFAVMHGAQEFLGIIESSEQGLSERLFAADLHGTPEDEVDCCRLGLP